MARMTRKQFLQAACLRTGVSAGGSVSTLEGRLRGIIKFAYVSSVLSAYGMRSAEEMARVDALRLAAERELGDLGISWEDPKPYAKVGPDGDAPYAEPTGPEFARLRNRPPPRKRQISGRRLLDME